MPIVTDNNYTQAEERLQELTVGFNEGKSINKLSQEFGIRREAISTVLMVAGVLPSTEGRDRLLAHVRANPGLSVDDLALQLDMQKSTISRYLRGTPEQQKVVTRKTTDYTVYPDIDKKKALKEAWATLTRAEKQVGLSRARYDKLVGHREDRPSSVTFIRRWGSWSASCEKAGIRAVKAQRSSYEKEFSDETILDGINEFITETGNTTFLAYKAWAREHGYPSGALVVIRLSGWSEARRQALQHAEPNG